LPPSAGDLTLGIRTLFLDADDTIGPPYRTSYGVATEVDRADTADVVTFLRSDALEVTSGGCRPGVR